MGYQNVATPRFYIDHGLWGYSTGAFTPTAGGNFQGEPSVLSQLNPSHPHSYEGWGFVYTIPRLSPVNYIAFLGHDISTQQGRCYAEYRDSNDNYDSVTETEVVNFVNGTNQLLDGFSIGTFTDDPSHPFISGVCNVADDQNIQGLGMGGKIGAISIGKYYDMPHSPDLSLSMSHEYDGIKQVTTKGGSTLSNANYYKPPMWDENREAWQLGDFPYYYNGRRTWDLSFSYISDSDIEPYSYYGNKYTSDTDLTNPTIEEGGDNWFQDVIRMTQGGHLPFIFSPDPSIEYYNDGTNPPRVPEFAICRFDMNTFKRTQVAHKMYTISIKLRETW